jgi:hypothetical protein
MADKGTSLQVQSLTVYRLALAARPVNRNRRASLVEWALRVEMVKLRRAGDRSGYTLAAARKYVAR